MNEAEILRDLCRRRDALYPVSISDRWIFCPYGCNVRSLGLCAHRILLKVVLCDVDDTPFAKVLRCRQRSKPGTNPDLSGMAEAHFRPETGLALAIGSLEIAASLEEVVSILRRTAREIVGSDGIAVVLRQATPSSMWRRTRSSRFGAGAGFR